MDADARLLILQSRYQNAFFGELAEVIVDEARRLGADAQIVQSSFDATDGDVFVVLPAHEYATLEGVAWLDLPGVADRTIGITAEQPSSTHFLHNVELGHKLAHMFDFSQHSVEAYRRAGVVADHLPFGWTPTWDRFDPSSSRGDPEVLFFGCFSFHREAALARLSRALWSHRSRLIISDNAAPNHEGSPSFLTGDDKRALLERTTLVVNLHQTVEPYFEWLRIAEAAHCGAVVVSEPSIYMEPFVAGEHLEVRPISGLADLIECLLDDPARLSELQAAAYAALRSRPFSQSVERLLTVADDLRRRPLGSVRLGPTRTKPYSAPRELVWERQRTELDVVRQAVREIRLDLIDMRRRLALMHTVGQGDSTEPVVRYSNPLNEVAAPPRISVLTALYNHADYVTAALESVAASGVAGVELIVVDDGSTDGSGDVVEEWMRTNLDIRSTLVASPINVGLPRARNAALAAAAGPLTFILDADNELVPGGLRALVAALDADPYASFAFGVLQRFDIEGPVGLLGWMPWEPWRLRHANFIDAMALVRTAELRRADGFTTDRRLHGWEDYDLWCRLAEAGCHGVHVPAVVARYRTSLTSMLSLTNISVDAAFDALRERAPRLMAGARPDMRREVGIGGEPGLPDAIAEPDFREVPL